MSQGKPRKEYLLKKAIEENKTLDKYNQQIQFPHDLMQSDMEKMPFVKWDRFIVNIKEKKIDLYGWIKRGDTHEDFVLLCYENISGEDWKTSYSTSSKLFDEQIFKALECEEERPNKCERVEEFFKIENVVRLK